jgi:flagellar protein FliJ
MKKFHFPLQKLLNIKKYNEDQKAIELGQVQAKLNKEIYQLNVFSEMKKSLFEGTDFLTSNLNSIRSSSEYLLQINNNIVRQKEKIELIKKEVEAKRVVLIEANREKKSVELLKENQQQGYRKEANRVARINEDEVASRIIQTSGL